MQRGQRLGDWQRGGEEGFGRWTGGEAVDARLEERERATRDRRRERRGVSGVPDLQVERNSPERLWPTSGIHPAGETPISRTVLCPSEGTPD